MQQKNNSEDETRTKLKQAGQVSDEHEFYTPYPKGYKKGKRKYVIVTGTVMSGLGKGIFSSSLAKLLKYKGLNVEMIKMEGYLNVDSGTLNPFRHGEVFVLDDGMECDMDLGTYERFLDKNLSKENYTTNGQIFTRVLDKERSGDYLGRDVQFIPHVTGEVKLLLRNLAEIKDADVVLVEIGGTVGDIENLHYIEAVRQLAYEEGSGNVVHVALTYILEPQFLGEQKSKAAQLGIKRLLEAGIQPQIIACRAKNPVTEKVREKISVYTNVPVKNVVSLHDAGSVYQIPLGLKEAGIDDSVIDLLDMNKKASDSKQKKELKKWTEYISKYANPQKEITIGITGKYTGLRDSYASILNALEHAGTTLETTVKVKWIETTKIEDGNLRVEDALSDVDGIIVPGGFGKRGIEGKITCVKYVRENKMPFLGICLGFQMALVDYARHVCQLEGANTTEVDAEAKHPVVCVLPDQLKIEGFGGTMRLGGRDIEVKKDTRIWELYGKKTTVRERFRHRYECNPEYIEQFEKAGVAFSGKAPNQPIMQFLELNNHPYFVATQSHPCFTSRPLRPAPLFYGLVEAAVKKKYGGN